MDARRRVFGLSEKVYSIHNTQNNLLKVKYTHTHTLTQSTMLRHTKPHTHSYQCVYMDTNINEWEIEYARGFRASVRAMTTIAYVCVFVCGVLLPIRCEAALID